MTKIGTEVAIMEASTGEVRFNPTIKSPWLIPTPHKAQIKSMPKSFKDTFSFAVNRETIQNMTQAKSIRIMVSPSGGTCVGSKYLEIGILTANKMFVIKINMCPFNFSRFIVAIV